MSSCNSYPINHMWRKLLPSKCTSTKLFVPLNVMIILSIQYLDRFMFEYFIFHIQSITSRPFKSQNLSFFYLKKVLKFLGSKTWKSWYCGPPTFKFPEPSNNSIVLPFKNLVLVKVSDLASLRFSHLVL